MSGDAMSGGGPPLFGGVDSEAEARRQKERIRYASIWVEVWWGVQALFRLPRRIWRRLR